MPFAINIPPLRGYTYPKSRIKILKLMPMVRFPNRTDRLELS